MSFPCQALVPGFARLANQGDTRESLRNTYHVTNMRCGHLTHLKGLHFPEIPSVNVHHLHLALGKLITSPYFGGLGLKCPKIFSNDGLKIRMRMEETANNQFEPPEQLIFGRN